MSKLKDFVLNHKKAFTIAGSSVAAVAVLGCGVLVGYSAAGKSDVTPAANYSQSDVNNKPQNTTSDNTVQNETPEVQSSANGITVDEAKDIALSDADLKEEDITIVKTETEVDDGITIHDIEFISGENKYEYEIDANTSEILHRELELKYELTENKLNHLNKPPLKAPESMFTSLEEAKAIALVDAGLTDAVFTKAALDREHERDVYIVEFYTDAAEYEYEILSIDGSVIKREVEYYDPKAAIPAKDAGLESAKKIAVEDAGIDYESAKFLKAEKDIEDGIEVYEIEFRNGATMYGYEIAASNNKIIKKETATMPGIGSVATELDESDKIYTAKCVAAADAGVDYKSVVFTKAELDNDDGREVCEIEFFANNCKYEYEIDTASREIVKREIESSPDIDDLPIELPGIDSSTIASDENKQIENIKDIALEDAGVKAEDATFTKAKLDRDDGRDVYEIEFYTSDREYEYEIDAQTGMILDKDSERRKGSTTIKTTGDYIGIEEAKKIALKDCGLSASDVIFTTAKQERDDGIDCYELEFCTPKHEYEYEIHCISGDILHNECHKHDRDDDNDCGHSGHH